ncbi:MAG: VOC family protein [Anaerolineae bacterium]|nr:VOC family protein [Anaerolineae bacterium]
MAIRRVVPNIKGELNTENRQFYGNVLGFDLAMDMGWIATFVSPTMPSAQVTLLNADPSTLHPDVSIEVDDVDAIHAKAVENGIPIVYPLTDEPWGVRRFFAQDPNGLVINIVSHRHTDRP